MQMKVVVRLETSVCFRITRLTNNQINSRKKSNIPKRRESDDNNAVTIVKKVYQNWVVYHKIQMHSFLKVDSLGETRCRKSWNQFKGCDSLSLRYVMRVSGKRKDHREKSLSKFFISEVLTLLNLRTGPMKRLKDSSDVPE